MMTYAVGSSLWSAQRSSPMLNQLTLTDVSQAGLTPDLGGKGDSAEMQVRTDSTMIQSFFSQTCAQMRAVSQVPVHILWWKPHNLKACVTWVNNKLSMYICWKPDHGYIWSCLINNCHFNAQNMFQSAHLCTSACMDGVSSTHLAGALIAQARCTTRCGTSVGS